MTRRVAVVGAGWAGLAAAVDASARGHAVRVFEMAREPGGRARSVGADGLVLDNGQHILIGAYVQTLALMRRVGVDPDAALLRLPLALVDARGHGLRLPPGAPVPAFVRGVLAQRGWRLRDRIALLAAAARWKRGGFRCDPTWSVDQLTRGLPESLREELIEPLCVAALNTPAAEASATVFLRVLRDALFAGPGAADLLLPRSDLSRLLPLPARAWLAARGAHVETGRRVERITPAADDRWRVDDEGPFDAVVLACTSTEAARLAAPVAPAWAASAAALDFEPIVTVYTRGRGAALTEPMLALPSGKNAPAQFVFDRGRLSGATHAGVLAWVASGARAWVERGADATAAAVRAQARRTFGETFGAALEPLRVITEKRATFRCTPGLVRPPAAIARGLLAAGDYVDGPYPATLEGAVRSGLAAAAAIDAAISGSRTPLP